MKFSRSLVGLVVLVLVVSVVGPAGTQPANAQKPKAKAAGKQTAPEDVAGKPTDYRSKNFLIHTDLGSADAKELLSRLETMLRLISRYWNRPPSGIIEMYVVKDLKNWPTGAIPAVGLGSIEAGAGVTVTQSISSATQFVAKSTVYAVADRGTPQHEAVHAYCGQTFGTTGPLWYSEGMAEMGQYWRDGEKSVQCHQHVIDHLRNSKPQGMIEIVNNTGATGDSWQNYAWRWALCHLLANNPNYSAQFHPLGLGFLTKKNIRFEQVYGPVADQISFEYAFFIKHLENGYRVDLCSWNWKQKTLPLGKNAITAKVKSAGGWQATPATVAKDSTYEYSSSGEWTTIKGGEAVTADGGVGGIGKLTGIVMKDYQLSEPFELGVSGSFVAPSDGQLFLRCADSWGSLADNTGAIAVRLKRGAEVKAESK
ncbi:MAG: hypothetical protein SGJ20_05915 [Planctomycetota bacterium]|nr:hypothetical protein [Planctomycetota bacterium]